MFFYDPVVLAKWTGIGAEGFWKAKIKRWAAVTDKRRPRFLVVCDGLSERLLKWPLFFRTLEDPEWAPLVSAILTDRPEHWCSLRSGMFGCEEIQVSGYDDRELQQALGRGSVRFEEIPPDLHPLIRKPRYCDLVCEHFDEMKRESDFTVGRLIWMDIKYRRQNKLDFPMSEDEFVEIIREIAKKHRINPAFERGSVQSWLPCPDPEGQIYREILDGLLERRTGAAPKFYAKETHLVFGLGMLIAEDVRETAGDELHTAEIADQIERWFEPHPEMDLKVKICESALFHAFLDSDYPSAGRGEFLRYWLKLRNATLSAQDAFVEYVTRAPSEFVRIAEELFAEQRDLGAAENFFLQSFCAHRDHPSVAPVLAQAIDHWMRQIHPCGDSVWSSDTTRREKEKKLVSGRIGREPCAGPLTIAGENLTFVDNGHLLRLTAL
jgi:hypothetical protein